MIIPKLKVFGEVNIMPSIDVISLKTDWLKKIKIWL